jgi:hypothetical protein
MSDKTDHHHWASISCPVHRGESRTDNGIRQEIDRLLGPTPAHPYGGYSSVQAVDEFRRQQAAQAIARIRDCYRRGLAIPDVR